ncbi:E-selectin [Acomys russatus]|uniref:E-selectin n=1 Tax=Acomys russatus TaxID=60746 RepID=UPI0021E256FD|nr:E-selectin [Acomys russatus]
MGTLNSHRVYLNPVVEREKHLRSNLWMKGTAGAMNISQFLSTLTFVLLIGKSIAWYYNASVEVMTYNEASAYCQQKYTHLVAIQNKEEINYLNSNLKYSPSYYWIGIRKVNNVWVWVGTQKPLTEEAKNWAPGEPNNKQRNEDCVEIYIQRPKDSGMWNDERCDKKKLALCYTASCTHTSCSGHGECVETINSYTCKCHPGFFGPNCEQVVTCKAQEHPDHGSRNCSHPFGPFSYNSSCSFGCNRGYLPSTTETTVWCTPSGKWSAPAPACHVVECEALTKPDNGVKKCSSSPGNFSWNTTCTFDCEEGYRRVGAQTLQCTSSGTWDNEKPSCRAVTCDAIPQPQSGSVSCSNLTAGEKFAFKSSCNFTCEPSFTLQGPAQVECNAQGQWTPQIPVCKGTRFKLLALPENVLTRQAISLAPCRRALGFTVRRKRVHIFVAWLPRDACYSPMLMPLNGFSLPAVECDAISPPQNGFMECVHATTRSFTYQSVCAFQCSEGFELHGSAQLACTSQGEWTQEVPSCQAVHCSSLEVPGKMNMSCSGAAVFGTVCDFACPDGWTLNGSSVLTCGATGRWSGMMPTCEAPTDTTHPLLVALSTAGTSLLALSSFIYLFMRYFRKKAKKFVPASSFQSLQPLGNHQAPSHVI